MSELAPYTVATYVAACTALLRQLPARVEGEIANFSISKGQYVFFDLKDEQEPVIIRCFMMAFRLDQPLEDGMRVVVEGKPSIYAKTSQFSVTVDRVQPVGEGSLKRAFELLKRKLESEGLFAPERKRSLPRIPTRVGVVSSSGAAGWTDFLRIVGQRLPGTHFTLLNVSVQGNRAEAEIVAALDYLNSTAAYEVVVLLRGGGSWEDLHAFNSERVARAIARSKAPVLTGIGHERDITIADLCADLRAATPTNAAQLLLPTLDEVLYEVGGVVQALEQRLHVRVAALRQYAQRVVHTTHQSLGQRLQRAHILTAQVPQWEKHLKHRVALVRTQVQHHLATITALSPLTLLQRGYSLTRTVAGQLLTSTTQVKSGDTLLTQLSDGQIQSTITP